MNPYDTSEFVPVLLLDTDLAQPLTAVKLVDPKSGKSYRRGLALIRAHTHPLGYVSLTSDTGEIGAADYARTIWEMLQGPITDYLQQHDLDVINALDIAGLSALDIPDYIRNRPKVLENAPSMSVIVTTRERPDSLEETLRSIAAVDYPRFEIVVVDNAPTTQATADRVARLTGEIPNLRYVREDRKGLCWARNCGMDAAQGEVTVYTDDDVLVDPHWLTALAEGFLAGENVACVTGLILPRELETPAQVWCEEHGGFSKGFVPKLYDLDQNRPDDPLYPFRVSLLGSGANMAFKTDVLRAFGGTDPALGAGTPVLSAAEFPPLFNVITHGYQLAYQPAAIIFHAHHEEYEKFRRQFYGYGVGFTAFLTKIILENPRNLLDLLRRLPYGIYFTLSPKSPRHEKKTTGYPKELNRLELLGMLYGPVAYVRSLIQVFWKKRAVSSKNGS